jgi:hypothetical protein
MAITAVGPDLPGSVLEYKTARRASDNAARRLMPFLILCLLIAFLDRVNVGFAALTMNKELGL